LDRDVHNYVREPRSTNQHLTEKDKPNKNITFSISVKNPGGKLE
jgi:hypothetical protein